jgi:serine/threonine protein kinase
MNALTDLLVDMESTDVETFFNIVRMMPGLDGVDKRMFYDVLRFFDVLNALRMCAATTDSAAELKCSIIVGYCAMAPFVARDGTYMNEASFTQEDVCDLALLYGSSISAFAASVGVDHDDNDEPHSPKKTMFEKQRKPDMHTEQNGRISSFCEVKPHGAPAADVAEDERKLVFLARTNADLFVARAHRQAGQSAGGGGAKEKSLEAGASGSTVAIVSAGGAVESCEKSNASASAGDATNAQVTPAIEEVAADAAHEEPTASATVASLNCHIGAYTLQIVGRKAEVTLLVQAHPSLYVNLRLFKINFADCKVHAAIQYLGLMVAIYSAGGQLDGDMAGKLFPNKEFEKLDNFVAKNLCKAAPMPNPLPPPRAQTAKNAKPAGNPTRHDVALGTLVVDHGDRAVVRGACGDVAFKVILTTARNAAAQELRVHALLTRWATSHVVPLLAHFEARVALPNGLLRRDSMVLVMPWCEKVNVAELRDVRDVAQCGDELLGALDALHRLGVLHRDVKWSNTLWMCAAKRYLVLSDFGLALQLDIDGHATLEHGVGTDSYMAPEVRDGSAMTVSAAADVYSAGVALCELPAHTVCEPLQAMVALMCAEKPHARPSAYQARRRWQRMVIPALEQLALAESSTCVLLHVQQDASGERQVS